MALNERQQLSEIIRRSREVLVALPPEPEVDALASALALRRILERQGKRTEVVAAGFTASPRTGFLPDVTAVRPELPQLRAMTLRVNLGDARLDNLSYEVADGELRINLLPRAGVLEPEAVRAESAEYRFDLVVTVGAADFESLGDVYARHPELFFRVPVVNIDRHAANEHFGAVNVVDLTATSLSEIVFEMFSGDRTAHDTETATALLAGIISATKSFRTDAVTPRTLAVTAELVAMGGRREEVVRHLFRTRGVGALRLWGRALARLKHDERTGLVWTVLTAADFVHAGAKEEELPGVVDELLAFCPEAQVVLILHESPAGICGLLETRKTHDARTLAREFGPAGSPHAVRFCVSGRSLVDVEREVVEKIKKGLAA